MKTNKKTVVWGVVLLLLIGGGVLCKMRWKVWFGNLPEIRYTLTSEPQRVLLTFGNDGERSRNVSWVCGGKARKARLEYTQMGSGDTLSVDGNTKFIRTLGGYTYTNWAKFPELAFDASYSYRVLNGDEASAWYSFRMQSDSTRNFSFVFIGDVQDTLQGKTREFMENVRHRLPDAEFYMFAGDFAERPMNCYWDEAYRSVDSIATNKPILVSPGNHEYFKGMKRVLGKRFAYAFSYLLESRYAGNNVFSIDYKDATIITLDSNRDSWYLLSQRDWLKKQLQASNKKWKIVMLHHPIYSIKSKMNNLPVRMMFNSLLKEYGVDLVLQGHEHNYGRMTSRTDDGAMTTPLYLVSHSSPKCYRLGFNDNYDRFGTNNRYYQSVEIHGDTLRMKAFQEDDSLYDDVCIVKDSQGVRVIDNATDIPESLEMPWLTGKKAKKFKEQADAWLKRKH